MTIILYRLRFAAHTAAAGIASRQTRDEILAGKKNFYLTVETSSRVI